MVSPAGDELRRQLLLAVLQDPADDLSRMAYADHLLEYADCLSERAKGELIHVCLGMKALGHDYNECEKEPCPGCVRFQDRPAYEALREREKLILFEWADYWRSQDTLLGRRSDDLHGRGAAGYYDGGMLSSITTSHDWFVNLHNAAALFSRYPIINVQFEDVSPRRVVDPNAPDGAYYVLDTFAHGLHAGLIAHHIDPNLYKHLPRSSPAVVKALGVRVIGLRAYGSLDRACDALSAACVKFGRAAAGLPPLKARVKVR